MEFLCADAYAILGALSGDKRTGLEGETGHGIVTASKYAGILTSESTSPPHEDSSQSTAYFPENALVDVIVLAPPWGGPDYSALEQSDLRTMILSGDGVELAQLAAKCCKGGLVYLLPKNTSKEQLQEIGKLLF